MWCQSSHQAIASSSSACTATVTTTVSRTTIQLHLSSWPCYVQGTPLAKAREIGESVMRQAQDLAAVSAGDANATVSLEAGPAAVAAAGSQTAQRKTVLLITPDEAASPTQPRKQFGKSASAWPTVTTATKAGEYSSSKTAAGRLHSPELSAADGRCAWHDDDEDDGMTSHRPANRGR